MPRGAPPPYDGDRCKNGCAGEPLARQGRYRGMCGECKSAAIDKAREKREGGFDDGITREDTGARRPSLTSACRTLTTRAAKLEKVLDERKAANIRARSELAMFKDALNTVGRVAQSLVNTSGSPADREGE